MTSQPLISIIILHHGHPEVTQDCLKQVLAQTWKNLEVLLVDNASESQVPETALTDDRIRVIRSETNLGYAGGNNLALREAAGAFLVLINNDVILPEDWVEHMVNDWPGPEWGLISPVIVKYGSGGKIQYAGFTPVSPTTGRNSIVDGGKQWTSQKEIRETAYAHGSAMMVSRAAYEAAGDISEQYFLYYEELDWSEKIRRAGFRIGVNNAVCAPHYGSLTLGKDSPNRWYYYHRGRLLFQRRWLKPSQKVAFFLYYLLIASPKEILSNLIHRKWQHLRAWWEALAWHLRHPGKLPPYVGPRG